MGRIKYKAGQTVGNNGVKFVKDTPSFTAHRRANFICPECGEIYNAILDNVKTGKSKSCNCLRITNLAKRSYVHGLSTHKLYKTWERAKSLGMAVEFEKNVPLFISYIQNLKDYERRVEDRLTLGKINKERDYERGNMEWRRRKNITY